MKNKTALTAVGLGIAAVVVYYYKSMTTTLKNLSVSVFGIKYNSTRTTNSAFTKVWFDLTLKVDNPTNRPVTLSETLLTFYVEGNKAGEVKNFDRFKIDEKRATNITITTYISSLNVVNLVGTIIKFIRDKKPINIQVKGTMNLEGNKVFIDQSVTLDYPKF